MPRLSEDETGAGEAGRSAVKVMSVSTCRFDRPIELIDGLEVSY